MRRGICQVCLRTYSVKRDGTMFLHQCRTFGHEGLTVMPKGSGKPPIEADTTVTRQVIAALDRSAKDCAQEADRLERVGSADLAANFRRKSANAVETKSWLESYAGPRT